MCEKKARPHAELIKEWADGAEIQIKLKDIWKDIEDPTWNDICTYRIKPEPKPDVVLHGVVERYLAESPGYPKVKQIARASCSDDNIKFTFDGETGKLKAVELI